MLFGEDRLASGKKQPTNNGEQANWIENDGDPCKPDHLIMLSCAALNRDVRLEPIALGERVACKGFKSEVGHEWVGKEDELQYGRQSHLHESHC